jgi:transposase
MMFKGKNSNQAVAAVARELCCFIWGMMTGHYSRTAQAEASVYRSELD